VVADPDEHPLKGGCGDDAGEGVQCRVRRRLQVRRLPLQMTARLRGHISAEDSMAATTPYMYMPWWLHAKQLRPVRR